MAIMEQVVLGAELVAERHWNRVGTGSGYGSGSGGRKWFRRRVVIH
jgi:hypothetical protein